MIRERVKSFRIKALVKIRFNLLALLRVGHFDANKRWD